MSEQTLDALVFGPRADQATFPTSAVPGIGIAPVGGPPSVIRLEVAADVVVEKVMSQDHQALKATLSKKRSCR